MPTGGLENPAVVLMPTGQSLGPKTASNMEPQGVRGKIDLIAMANGISLISFFDLLCSLDPLCFECLHSVPSFKPFVSIWGKHNHLYALALANRTTPRSFLIVTHGQWLCKFGKFVFALECWQWRWPTGMWPVANCCSYKMHSGKILGVSWWPTATVGQRRLIPVTAWCICRLNIINIGGQTDVKIRNVHALAYAGAWVQMAKQSKGALISMAFFDLPQGKCCHEMCPCLCLSGCMRVFISVSWRITQVAKHMPHFDFLPGWQDRSCRPSVRPTAGSWQNRCLLRSLAFSLIHFRSFSQDSFCNHYVLAVESIMLMCSAIDQHWCMTNHHRG